MGALRPPNPPTAERGGAVFWCAPLGAVLEILTWCLGEGFEKYLAGRKSMGFAFMAKIKARSSPLNNKGAECRGINQKFAAGRSPLGGFGGRSAPINI